MRERARPRSIARWCARGLAALFVAYVGVAMTARWTWCGEVAASARWYAGLGGLALAVLALVTRERIVTAIVLALALFQLAPSLPLYAPHPTPAPGPATSVLCANLLWGNPSAAAEIAALRERGPDLVGLLELGPETRAAVRALRDVYPHQLVYPADDAAWNADTWGLALIARVPLHEPTMRWPLRDYFPMLEARAEVAGGSVLVRLVHAPNPSSSGGWELRQQYLAGLMELAWPDDALLVGDLNTTSSSPAFSSLLDSAGLRDSRLGLGRQADWRPQPPFDGLRFDILHALGGSAVELLERATRPMPGSDHDALQLRVRRSSSERVR